MRVGQFRGKDVRVADWAHERFLKRFNLVRAKWSKHGTRYEINIMCPYCPKYKNVCGFEASCNVLCPFEQFEKCGGGSFGCILVLRQIMGKYAYRYLHVNVESISWSPRHNRAVRAGIERVHDALVLMEKV